MSGLILGIETSCDDTAAAVARGREVLSSVVSSQIAEHRKYGGVVPEIASRRHTENVTAVTREALSRAGADYSDISAVAVTYAPGLIGALLVGVNFAKGLALSLGVPLVPVHHLRGHIAANYIESALEPPFLALTVSGGNTQLVAVEGYTEFRTLGRTVDDAAGECFDKAARAMGLPYPGGAELDRVADDGKAGLYKLPRPVTAGEYDFSFSGLKTAVLNTVNTARQKGGEADVPALAGALRRTVCEILRDKTLAAADSIGAEKIALAGGVSANSMLRRLMADACRDTGRELYLPDPRYCGDNAAMIAVQGYYELAAGHTAGSALNAYASMGIEGTA